MGVLEVSENPLKVVSLLGGFVKSFLKRFGSFLESFGGFLGG